MNDSFIIDLAEILEAKYPHGFHAPADIDISNFLEFADDDWSFDLEAYFADRHLVAVIWNSELVLAQRPDLTEDQAWEILRACQAKFTAEEAPRDTVIEVAERLFPKPTGKAGLKALLALIERRIDALPTEVATDPAGHSHITALFDVLESLVKGH